MIFGSDQDEFKMKVKAIAKELYTDPNNKDAIRRLNQLDKKRAEYMIDAERKCRKFKAGEVPYSPYLHLLGAKVVFLRLIMNKIRNREIRKKNRKKKNISQRRIKKAAKKAKMVDFKWQSYSLENINELYKASRKQYYYEKNNAWKHRADFLHQIAEENSKRSKTTAKT